MESFERTGTFFSQSSSASSAGDLGVSGETFVLRLDAPLADVEYPEQGAGEEPPTIRLPLLFGDLRGDDQVTLLNAIGTGHDEYESWRCQ